MRGYGYPENFERLRRCEEMAEKKGVAVAQLAMAWIHRQGLNTFAVVSTSGRERMQMNIDALNLELTPEEADWLDLR
jgi:aryl-alcohol dehydrogenase-like predicted oxidoreductase